MKSKGFVIFVLTVIVCCVLFSLSDCMNSILTQKLKYGGILLIIGLTLVGIFKRRFNKK